ncbi:IclR family transcriptional regulator [Microbacterium arabinogalactanolyticum]|uniref:IclR family transcriptional regulator n=2 Tax=Microbacterium arabinogalactanolyticum TaxID=69365 RepID=A0ABQ5NEN6_9MICO|nr:IclR family transcriptional regulator [Microbacterium arabinogalactanolyticum]
MVKAMPAASSGSVQSVARAFALLEALAAVGGESALASLASATGLAVPTAHRLLGTLHQLGYVRQLEDRRYALGAGLIGLGRQAVPQVADAAMPLLAGLEEAFHETANLAVLDGDLVLYAGQVPSRQRMRMFTEVGRRVLPHSTGVGKAMLSTMPEPQVRALIERTGLPRFTPQTLVDAEAFIADLRRSRARGFAADDSEQEVGVRCIAVAVPGLGQPAAISVSGPAARITDAVVPSVVEALHAAAAELAQTAR